MGHDQLQRGRDQAGTSPGLPTPIGGNDSRHNPAQKRAVSPVFRPVGRGGGESHAAGGAGKNRRGTGRRQPHVLKDNPQPPASEGGGAPPNTVRGRGRNTGG